MKGTRCRILLVLCALAVLFSLCGLVACGEDHKPEAVAAKAATCTEEGNIAYYFCSHCGKSFADEDCKNELSDADIVVAALGHDLTHHDAVAATCTTDGNIEYWSCNRCNLLFSDAEGTTQVATVTLAAAHKIEKVPLVEPTTEADGAVEH